MAKKDSLSDCDKAAMIAATRDSAHALVDDLDHIREIIARPEPSPGDIRRISNQLRRIIVEPDLRTVAAPRVGRIELVAPDLRPLYRHVEIHKVVFISGGSLDLYGVVANGICLQEGQGSELRGYDPDAEVLVRLDSFRDQRVLYAQGRWVTRGDIIKYVANVAHGVHSTEPREWQHQLIRFIRYACTIGMVGNQPFVEFSPIAITGPDAMFEPDRKKFDIALLLLLSAARYLTRSPQVQKLEAIIATEAK